MDDSITMVCLALKVGQALLLKSYYPYQSLGLNCKQNKYRLYQIFHLTIKNNPSLS